MKAFFILAYLGVSTTFSACSLYSIELYERGGQLFMSAYKVSSVFVSILALLVGIRFGRLILS